MTAAPETVPAEDPSAGTTAGVPWRAVLLFVVLACGLAWLVALPLWLGDHASPGYATQFQALATAMMFTPAVSALAVMFLMRVPRRGRLRYLGIWPLRPAKRVVWFSVAMLVVPAILVGAGVAISAAFGWLQLDLQHFSGYQQIIDAQLAAAGVGGVTLPPITVLAVTQLVAIPLIGLLNVITLATLGEELAWRGWLLPTLRSLGTWPALLLSGAIWGVWHAPIILLGYNFNRTDVSGVLLMMAGCMAWGTLFGWLRLRTGSVWPAVIAHGVFNAAGSVMLVVLPAAGQVPEMALVNPLGVSGWIVVAIVVVVLVLTRQFGVERQLAPSRKPHSDAHPGTAPGA